MPVHEFGIMPSDPQKGKSYIDYEPEKYNCILVDDKYILPFLNRFREIKCFWHTVDRSEYGLAYYGITLIPPESLGSVIEIIWNKTELSELIALLSEAERENKYVIHFGI